MTHDHLFVYGTLRRGADAAHRLADAELVGVGVVRARLYAIETYVGAIPSEDAADVVHGEVYRLARPDQTLARLDRYEGRDPSDETAGLFRRVPAPVTLADGRTMMAWIYFYNRDTASLRRIDSGDFLGSRTE